MECSVTDWISALSNAAQALAVLVGLVLAYRGFDQWKRQHNWTRNSELAEETLLAANAYRDAVARIRNPIGYSGEGSTRESDPGELEDRKRTLDSAFTTFERIQKEREVLSRYFNAESRCRVRFGEKIIPYLDGIRGVHVDLINAARLRFEDARERIGTDDPEVNKMRKEAQRTYWAFGTPETPDDVQKRISNAIGGLEAALKAYVHELP